MSTTVVRESEQVLNAAVPAATLEQNIDLIGHVQVTLTAQVGTLSMPISQLFRLAKGDVLELNELLEEPVTLFLNGKPVARAELLGVEDHFGIRILEVA